jgi:hypothetical protein
MSDAFSIPPVAPDPVNGPAAAKPALRGDGARSAERSAPAFEALLERLEARAAELELRSRTLERPEELPDAVDAARASLADALALGEELLEAYRAAEQRGDATRGVDDAR